ncbi:MAG: hypothetical protein HY270_12900 [Deltaproteobacteria bacterium]|nr:hypothetical protein [Deltaproteobacteria bacterium]
MAVGVMVTVGVKVTQLPLSAHWALKIGTAFGAHKPPTGGPQVTAFWQQSLDPGVGVAVGTGVEVGDGDGVSVGVNVGVSVKVVVGVGVKLGVAVGVKGAQMPLSPWHDAPKTGTLPGAHWPLAGGPHEKTTPPDWQQSSAPGVFVRVGVRLGVGVRVGVDEIVGV